MPVRVPELTIIRTGCNMIGPANMELKAELAIQGCLLSLDPIIIYQ